MGLPFFGKKDNEDQQQIQYDELYETQHRLVIYDQEKRSCEIYIVTDITDKEVVSMGRAVAPIADCEIHISQYGRVYTLNASSQYIEEAKNLALLQQSTVLSQITAYREPEQPNANMDLMKWAMVFLLFVAIIAAAF